MTLSRYITRLLALRLVVALLTLTALLQIFDLFNNARALLSRGGTTSDLLTYAALRLPITVEQSLPIAVLVASLATLLSLTRSNEMIALRGAGLTIYRLLAICAPTAALAAIVHFILIDVVTPRSERRFADWWNSFAAPGPRAENNSAMWLRGSDAFLRVGGVTDSGMTLNDIEIVELAPGGVVTRWMTADLAQREPEGWILRDVRSTLVRNGTVAVEVESRRRWPSLLDPASVVAAASATESLSIMQLRQVLQGTRAGSNSPSYYLTRLYRIYAFPFASLLMLLLAAPAAYMIRRQGEAAIGLALGFGLGMAYLVTDGLLSALGAAGVVPPLLAAWTSPVLFALIGLSVLLHYED